MKLMRLEFTAELVKIIDFKPADDLDTDGQFLFQGLKCEGCEDSRASIKDLSVCASRTRQVYYKDRDHFEHTVVHAYNKCGDCRTKRVILMRPLPAAFSPKLTAEFSRAGNYVPLMHFSIAGLKVSECSFIGNFEATTEDNRKITIPFTRGQDYEEKGGTGVAVRNPKLRIVNVVDQQWPIW